MSRTRTQAALAESVIRPAFPPRDVEGDAMAAFNAVQKLTLADPHQLRENIRVIVEIREKINFIFEEVLG